MNNLAYDSLHKFFVSAGAALIITPIVSFYFLLQGEVQLISHEEYENLSAYSQHCIDFKEYLLFIIQKAGVFVALFVMLLGVFLLILGIRGWKNNQNELDKQLALTTEEVQKKLQAYSEADKEAKDEEVKEEAQEAEQFTAHRAEADEKEKELSEIESTELPKDHRLLSEMCRRNKTYSNYREVEKDFYERGIYKLLNSREYSIEKEKKINNHRFDGLAISKTDSNDVIFEVKWWHDYRNKIALENACKRLKNNEYQYIMATNRKCEAKLVIITKPDTVSAMDAWINDVSGKIDTHGISIEVMSEANLI